MKAVVMENKKRICVVLCEDGLFRKIRGDYEIGETISVTDSDFIVSKKTISIRKQGAAIISAVAAAAAVLFSVGYYETSTACSYVTLDACPSIEYTLNRLDKVIKVSALNKEAEPIIETLTHQGVKYNSIGDAIDMTVEVLRANDYLNDDNSEILIDVISNNDARSKKLTRQVENSVTAADAKLSISLLKSNQDDRASAISSGVSTGVFKASSFTTKIEPEEPAPAPAPVQKASEAASQAPILQASNKSSQAATTPSYQDDIQPYEIPAPTEKVQEEKPAPAPAAPKATTKKNKKKKTTPAASTASSAEPAPENPGEGASAADTPAESSSSEASSAEAPADEAASASSEAVAPPVEPAPAEPAAPTEEPATAGSDPAPTDSSAPPAEAAPAPTEPVTTDAGSDGVLESTEDIAP